MGVSSEKVVLTALVGILRLPLQNLWPLYIPDLPQCYQRDSFIGRFSKSRSSFIRIET